VFKFYLTSIYIGYRSQEGAILTLIGK